MEFKTIQFENIRAFDRACNELSKEGWMPFYPMCVVMIPFSGENLTKYVQQWHRVNDN